MEMQMSSKSQSFSRPTWYSALSTIASGVGPPNFSRCASPPSRSLRRCELADGVPLPPSQPPVRGLRRRCCPDSSESCPRRTRSPPARDGSQNECPPPPAAASSAQISRSASAACISGTAQRTMSQPASASARICARVACASRVSVLVMDCTAMGRAAANQYVPNLYLLCFFHSTSLSQNGKWKMENECAAHSRF